MLALVCFAGATTLGASPYPAVVLVFVLNGMFNFALFRLWAFPRSNRTVGSEARRFMAVAVLTLAVNYAIFALLYSVVGLAAVPAQALAIVGATPTSFVANRAWSFRGAVRSEAAPSDTPQ